MLMFHKFWTSRSCTACPMQSLWRRSFRRGHKASCDAPSSSPLLPFNEFFYVTYGRESRSAKSIWHGGKHFNETGRASNEESPGRLRAFRRSSERAGVGYVRRPKKCIACSNPQFRRSKTMMMCLLSGWEYILKKSGRIWFHGNIPAANFMFKKTGEDSVPIKFQMR
jgi:hypothetical protein